MPSRCKTNWVRLESLPSVRNWVKRSHRRTPWNHWSRIKSQTKHPYLWMTYSWRMEWLRTQLRIHRRWSRHWARSRANSSSQYRSNPLRCSKTLNQNFRPWRGDKMEDSRNCNLRVDFCWQLWWLPSGLEITKELSRIPILTSRAQTTVHFSRELYFESGLWPTI